MGCSSGNTSEQTTGNKNTNNKQAKNANEKGNLPDIKVGPFLPLFQKYVTRKDLRSLSSEEQQRFYNAAVEMLTNTYRGGESSEFFRLAKMHGMPEPYYCQHGVESFLSWHRPYLIEFEESLQRADRIANPDFADQDPIALPYWDWTQEINGEVFPKIIRDNGWTLSNNFLNNGAKVRSDSSDDSLYLEDVLVQTRPTEDEYRSMISSYNIKKNAYGSLMTLNHKNWSYSYGQSAKNLETPHNDMHSMSGYPMRTVSFAAYDIIFYLHHCNIDRFFQAHLEMSHERGRNSKNEFKDHQEELVADGASENYYTAAFDPFKTYPKEYYVTDTVTFGYRYDNLPSMLEYWRDFFIKIPFEIFAIAEFSREHFHKISSQVHVFVFKNEDESKSWKVPNNKSFRKEKSFAGSAGIFTQTTKICTRCKEKGPITVHVDITDYIVNNKLDHDSVSIRIMTDSKEGFVEENIDHKIVSSRVEKRALDLDLKT